MTQTVKEYSSSIYSELKFPDDSLSYKSTKKQVWICPDAGHEYSMSPRDKFRVRNSTNSVVGCPICANRVLLQGFNDLQSANPEIAREFIGNPKNIIKTSSKESQWFCSVGHQYSTSVSRRLTKNYGCYYCSGQKILVGFNDLNTTHPELTKKLKNTDDALKTTSGSKKKLIWICDVNPGHEYFATPYGKTTRGVGCAVCAGKQIQPGFNDLKTTHPDIANKLKNKSVLTTKGSWKPEVWVCELGHEWEAPTYVRVRDEQSCPTCSAKLKISRPEKYLQNYLGELGVVFSSNVRNIIEGELDIYIPSKNIAIEFNGVYWHSTKVRSDPNYHKNKTDACRNLGIQLIHIWEDDYKRDPELIHGMLKHKLGVSDEKRVYARNTVVREISSEVAREFLEKNHIQGYGAGSIRLGMYVKNSDELVAVTTLKRHENTLTLERYATSVILPGGQSKFLKYIDSNIEYKKVITFADYTVSDGSLYEKTGWTLDGIIPPDYKYVINGERVHKFNYRLKRFREDPSLEFREGLTEKELATLNNLPRIYDAGKARYVRYCDIIN